MVKKKSKKMGRPLISDVPSSELVAFRVTPNQKDMLKTMAHFYGGTISEYMKSLVDEHIQNNAGAATVGGSHETP